MQISGARLQDHSVRVYRTIGPLVTKAFLENFLQCRGSDTQLSQTGSNFIIKTFSEAEGEVRAL